MHFILCHTVTTFNNPVKEAFLKTLWGKGENAGNQHFLHFPQCFQLFPNKFLCFSHIYCGKRRKYIFSFSHNIFNSSQTNFYFLVTFIVSSANAFNLSFAKELQDDSSIYNDAHRLTNANEYKIMRDIEKNFTIASCIFS